MLFVKILCLMFIVLTLDHCCYKRNTLFLQTAQHSSWETTWLSRALHRYILCSYITRVKNKCDFLVINCLCTEQMVLIFSETGALPSAISSQVLTAPSSNDKRRINMLIISYCLCYCCCCCCCCQLCLPVLTGQAWVPEFFLSNVWHCLNKIFQAVCYVQNRKKNEGQTRFAWKMAIKQRWWW